MKCGYGEECRIDHEGKGHCQCPSCQRGGKEVCGTDDRTYENECELRRQACLNKTEVDVKHRGACGKNILHCFSNVYLLRIRRRMNIKCVYFV